MPNLNFLISLNTYSDTTATNAPTLNNFKWARQVSGVPLTAENSEGLSLAASASATLLTNDTKSFLYLESDQTLSVVLNGGAAITLNPFIVNGLVQPGVFCFSGTIASLVVTNTSSTVAANVFFAALG